MYTLVHTHCYVHSLTPCICHTYSTYTYSTLALLQKWNLVHNTYVHSCTVHLYARILMNNIKHVYTRSHTHMYIARKVYSKLVLCTCTCNINSFNCFMHVFDFYTLSLCSLRVELPYGWFSVHRHSHHRSQRCEIKLSYWAQPLLNFILFAMLSFVPLARLFSKFLAHTEYMYMPSRTHTHTHTHTHTL